MKLIIGLGNPGNKYENTRHNAGFMAIDSFAKKYNASFSLDTKLQGMISSINIAGNKAILLKPMTYMNLSGESVYKVMNYYKIDVEDIMVICDDLDSRLGRVRLRAKGSAGGHNGIKNIIENIKTSEFKRVRVGISKDKDRNVIDYVLGKFNEEDKVIIDERIEIISCLIEDFVRYDFNKLMSIYNK